MRSRRRSPKGGVQAEKQLQYVRLIAAGVSNSEVCPRVGIDRKMGNRWRYGRTVRNSAGERVHYAPVKITEPRARSPRYLSEAERLEIADLLRAGHGVRAVARRVGRAASTISREIRRNVDSDGRYRPHRAEHLARARAGKPRARRVTLDTVLGETVAELLGKRWSPEQSLTSCVSDSSGSELGGCARSRSIRRSTTLGLCSRVRLDVGGVVGGCLGCSAVGG